MAARKIVCTNEDGLELILTDTFSPFVLESCEGIYEFKNKVSTSENTMTDGATYQGSVTSMRNIILTLRDRPEADHRANRALLYNLFKPKSPGKFEYIENDESRSISYYVEQVYVTGEERSRRATISLLCPDPFFVAPDDITVQMAGWVSNFEFVHEFLDEGETFGDRINEKIKSIENSSAADNIGLTIKLEAGGPVVSPTLYHIEQNESITVGTEANPLSMANGDVVIITTGTNDKHVYLVSSGVKTEINEYLSEESEFLQLMHGTNTFGYSAVSGEEYLTVTISFRYRYLGV